jgi:hypothetical protein
LPYLLELGVEILSFDAYQLGFMPKQYAGNVAEFIRKGGVISWGIVPTESAVLAAQTPEKLAAVLSDYWQVVSDTTGLPLDQLAAQALVAPARCCLSDIGLTGGADESTTGCRLSTFEESTVEKAFAFVAEVSRILKDKYGV